MSRSAPRTRSKKQPASQDPEWLRGERHGARAGAEMRQKYGRAFAEDGLRQLRLNVRRGEDVEAFDRGYLRGYEQALAASPEVLAELVRPLTPEEIKRDIAQALATRRSTPTPRPSSSPSAGNAWATYTLLDDRAIVEVSYPDGTFGMVRVDKPRRGSLYDAAYAAASEKAAMRGLRLDRFAQDTETSR